MSTLSSKSIEYVLGLVLFCLSACTSSPTDFSELQAGLARTIFSNSVTEFEVRVFYEAGATPLDGALFLGGPETWDITENSYATLFQDHPSGGAPRTITVQKSVSDMDPIADQGRSNWSADELLALSGATFSNWNQGNKIVIPVFFLNGSFQGNANILGVHFSGSPAAFVFKDNVPAGSSISQRYVEQAVVIHEIGHAVGFVNNGVPMLVNHEDPHHAGHTSNSNCVMYWAIESSVDIVSVVDDFILNGSLNLFGSEILADANAFRP